MGYFINLFALLLVNTAVEVRIKLGFLELAFLVFVVIDVMVITMLLFAWLSFAHHLHRYFNISRCPFSILAVLLPLLHHFLHSL
jgi:vancomycin permeability regulator SanA